MQGSNVQWVAPGEWLSWHCLGGQDANPGALGMQDGRHPAASRWQHVAGGGQAGHPWANMPFPILPPLPLSERAACAAAC